MSTNQLEQQLFYIINESDLNQILNDLKNEIILYIRGQIPKLFPNQK